MEGICTEGMSSGMKDLKIVGVLTICKVTMSFESWVVRGCLSTLAERDLQVSCVALPLG